MTPRIRGLLLLVIQCAIIASLGVLHFHQFRAQPHAWVPMQLEIPQNNPAGTIMRFQPMLDTCALPHTQRQQTLWKYAGADLGMLPIDNHRPEQPAYWWKIQLAISASSLVAVDSGEPAPPHASNSYRDQAAISQGGKFFVLTQPLTAACGPQPVAMGLLFRPPDSFQPPHIATPITVWGLLAIPPGGAPRILAVRTTRPSPADGPA